MQHCVKSIQIRSYFWSVFSRIRNEYGYFVSLRIQSECGKIRTRNNSVFGHFSRSEGDPETLLQEPVEKVVLGDNSESHEYSK